MGEEAEASYLEWLFKEDSTARFRQQQKARKKLTLRLRRAQRTSLINQLIERSLLSMSTFPIVGAQG